MSAFNSLRRLAMSAFNSLRRPAISVRMSLKSSRPSFRSSAISLARREWAFCIMAPSVKAMVTIVVSMAMVLPSSHEGRAIAPRTGADVA